MRELRPKTHSPNKLVRGRLGIAQFPQKLNRVDARVVAVAERNRVGVVADRPHRLNLQWPGLIDREDG